MGPAGRALRSTAWLVAGVAAGALTLLVLVGSLLVGVAGLPLLIGVPVLAGLALLGLPVGALERRRLRLLGHTLDTPHDDPGRTGLGAWLGCRYREPATWRELACAVVLAALWPLDLLVLTCLLAAPLSLLAAPAVHARYGEVKLLKAVVLDGPGAAWAAVPAGLLALAAGGYLLTAYARLRAWPVRALLARRDAGVPDLLRSRTRLVDAFDAERRRIERDLHDGAQQRLVALGMTLGVARIADPAELPTLVADAHRQAGLALAELQDLIQGIHPRILTDRGLPAALAELGDRSPVPVRVRAELPGRLPPRVEACAYFVAAEALTNVARHSGATAVRVTADLRGGDLRGGDLRAGDLRGGDLRGGDLRAGDLRAGATLTLEVTDDGAGGADPARGTGLTGLADRVAAAGGRLVLTSPPGGPTTLRAELPCR
jgi:signal transduction histidine kinase